MKMIKNIFSRLHVYVLWLLASAVLWGWVFTLVTDAPQAEKVVVFVDAYGCEDTALAEALGEDLPAGIRMVQVHPFSYAMFNDSELLSADIYIMRASDAADRADSIAPLDTIPFDPGGAALCEIGGTACGVMIHAAGGAASGFIQYEDGGAPAEDYYLFFNRESPHTGETDTAAVTVAARLLALEGMP